MSTASGTGCRTLSLPSRAHLVHCPCGLQRSLCWALPRPRTSLLASRALRPVPGMEVQDAQQPAVGVQEAGEKQPTPLSVRKLSSASVRADLVAQIRGLAESYGAVPDICKRRAPGEPDPAQGAQVHDWEELRRRREFDLLQSYPPGLHPSTFVPTTQVAPAIPDAPGAAAAAAAVVAAAAAALPVPMVPAMPSTAAAAAAAAGLQGGVPLMPPAAAAALPAEPRPGVRQVGKVTKASKSKAGGRTFTSKYRGVHQTFPTRRWEAQFRRNGKPTSLGCFDHEEQAARAYDKMMLWCELHNAAGVKGGITNFDPSEYEADMPFLQQCSQDELVQLLRSDGRRQAAQRMLKQKRDGAALYHAGSEGSDDD